MKREPGGDVKVEPTRLQPNRWVVSESPIAVVVDLDVDGDVDLNGVATVDDDATVFRRGARLCL